MSRVSVLARGRAAAEAGMIDACVITRDGVAVTNLQTGGQIMSTVTLYTGRCRLQQHIPGGAKPETEGEAFKLLQPKSLQLPVAGTTGILPGDKVTMTACVNDADIVGKVLLVRELGAKSEATARRLGVQEIT